MAPISTVDLVVNSSYSLLGISAIIVNSFLLRLYAKNRKSVKSKSSKRFQIVLMVGDVILGAGILLTSLNNWRLALVDSWYTSFFCLTVTMPNICGGVFTLLVLLILSLERLVALLVPLQYRKFSTRHCWLYVPLTICLMITAVFGGFNYYGVDFSGPKPPSCIPTAIRIDALKPLVSYFNCAVGSAVLLIYCIVYAMVVARGRNLRELRGNRMDNNSRCIVMKEELDVTRVVTVITIACMVSYVLPNIVITALTDLKLITSSSIGMYVSVFQAANSTVNGMVFLWRDNLARKTAKRMLCGGMANNPPENQPETHSTTQRQQAWTITR